MLVKLDKIKSDQNTLFGLIQIILFEIYFLYNGITGLVQIEVQSTQAIWLKIIIKVVLGFVVFKLYTAGNKRLAITGTLFAVVILATIYAVYIVSPDVVYPILGGMTFFVISLNSFFLIHYLRHPESITGSAVPPDKFYAKPAFRAGILAIVLLWITVSPSGLMQLATLLFWLLFYLRTEGVWVPKQR
jgi:hypothetical protein